MSAIVFGALVGAGLWLIGLGLRPPALSLTARLAGLAPTPPATLIPPSQDGARTGWSARVGRPLAPALAALGLPRPRVRRDLGVLGRPQAVHLAEQATAALTGLLLPALLGALATSTGIGVSPLLITAGSLTLAVALPLAVDADAHTRAAARRQDTRTALAVFLDLATAALAAGAGLQQALTQAADAGTGYGFTRLRDALTQARLTRIPIPDVFAQLADELDVGELAEVSASLALAGSEGARIRASLSAKAAGLRTRRLADIDAAAEAATERMSLPVVAMFLGFLIFIGYPALAATLGNL